MEKECSIYKVTYKRIIEGHTITPNALEVIIYGEDLDQIKERLWETKKISIKKIMILRLSKLKGNKKWKIIWVKRSTLKIYLNHLDLITLDLEQRKKK